MFIMSRTLKFFDHARTVALMSEYKFRHGALLVKSNKIIKASYNKSRAVRFAHKYHLHGTGSLHAEIGCILNLSKERTDGCEIYVVRIAGNGQYAQSCPCSMCQTICSEMGVKRIHYSTHNGFETMRL
jgi:deoxycytidylate deaminase